MNRGIGLFFGTMFHVAGNRYHVPLLPWVSSQPLPDDSTAGVVKVRLLAEDWHSPNWLEEGGDPKNMSIGHDMGWGKWLKAGVEWRQVGGTVARFWAGLFYNESDTRDRLTAIHFVVRYR
jgi:hypothetical protein